MGFCEVVLSGQHNKDLFGYSISFGHPEFVPTTQNPRKDTKARIGNAGLFFTITQ